MSNRSSLMLKRSLLLFWAVWLTIVFITNVLDGCKALGLLGEASPSLRAITVLWLKPRPVTARLPG